MLVTSCSGLLETPGGASRAAQRAAIREVAFCYCLVWDLRAADVLCTNSRCYECLLHGISEHFMKHWSSLFPEACNICVSSVLIDELQV